MRKLSVLLAGLSALMTAVSTSADEPPVVCCFSQPESVAWDSTTQRWFVSNRAGNQPGFISAITTDGTVEMRWVEGLNSPFGIAARDGTLYAADGNQVVAIDIASRTILWTTPLTGSGANDLAADPDSDELYVSRSSPNVIEVVHTEISETQSPYSEVFLSGSVLASPNGLFVEAGTLYIVNVSFNGSIRKVSLSDPGKTIVPVTGAIGFLDGIQKLGPSFYVTDVITGVLWRVGNEGQTRPIPIGYFPTSADLGLDPVRGVLGIPSGQNMGAVMFRIDPLPLF